MRFHPTTYEELAELVKDESIHLGDIDTSQIDNMRWLFCNSKRKDFSGIEGWDTSNVKNMVGMFDNAIYFNADISGWNVSNVWNFTNMFRFAKRFNQPIGKWDTSSAAMMEATFEGAYNFNQPLNSWDTSKVWSMNFMFLGAKKFNQPLDKWDMSAIKKMAGGCYQVANFFTGAPFNQNIDSWDLSWECYFMLENSPLMQNPPKWIRTKFDSLYNAKINKYQPMNREDLAFLCAFEIINLGDIDTSQVTDMVCVFSHSNRRDFSGIEGWDTSNVKNMDSLFLGAKHFNADISGWNVANVESMSAMFMHARLFNADIRAWNVARVRDFSRMFDGALRFNRNLDSWAVDTNAILLNDKDDDKPFHSVFFESPLQQNPPKWYLRYITSLFDTKSRKYIPKNEDELGDLIALESVHLGDIDTSFVMDMQWLDMYLRRRKDFSGIEGWNVNEKCKIHGAFYRCPLSDNPPKWYKDRVARI